jgi:hypothetical protein
LKVALSTIKQTNKHKVAEFFLAEIGIINLRFNLYCLL